MADEAPELSALVRKLDTRECKLIVDLNYDRPDNFWQHLADRQRIQFLDGLMPLAYQARRTLALWTGIQVPPEAFVEALKTDS